MSIVIQNSQPHPRIVIRKRVMDLLKPNTDLAGRWFCSRPAPAFFDELPCGLIYFTDETAEHKGSAPRYYERTLLLTTEVLHMIEPERELEIDNWLDSRAFEIEAAFFENRWLGFDALIQDTKLVRTQPTTINIEGEMDIASIRLFWEITWINDNYNQSTLDEFLRFTNTINTTDNAQVVDNVTIREA